MKIDTIKLQKAIIDNKVKKGFNTTSIEQEFCFLTSEVGEAYDAYFKKKSDLGEELADIGIFLFGIAEILNFDLGKEIINKIEKNKKRKYTFINGVYEKINEKELQSIEN